MRHFKPRFPLTPWAILGTVTKDSVGERSMCITREHAQRACNKLHDFLEGRDFFSGCAVAHDFDGRLTGDAASFVIHVLVKEKPPRNLIPKYEDGVRIEVTISAPNAQ